MEIKILGTSLAEISLKDWAAARAEMDLRLSASRFHGAFFGS
jgi:hypothetical protein